MFRSSLILFAAMILSLALAPGSAEASRSSDYRDGMIPFLPVIEAWAQQAEGLALDALTRPASRPDPGLVELIARGRSIEADLIGTSATAPVRIKGRHMALARNVRQMTDALEGLGDDAPAAAAEITRAHAALHTAIRGTQSLLQRLR